VRNVKNTVMEKYMNLNFKLWEKVFVLYLLKYLKVYHLLCIEIIDINYRKFTIIEKIYAKLVNREYASIEVKE